MWSWGVLVQGGTGEVLGPSPRLHAYEKQDWLVLSCSQTRSADEGTTISYTVSLFASQILLSLTNTHSVCWKDLSPWMEDKQLSLSALLGCVIFLIMRTINDMHSNYISLICHTLFSAILGWGWMTTDTNILLLWWTPWQCGKVFWWVT